MTPSAWRWHTTDWGAEERQKKKAADRARSRKGKQQIREGGSKKQ